MARDNPISRRTAMKLTGAAASTALVAGCSSGGDGGDDGSDSDGSEGINIDPETDIRFSAETSHWEGVEPSEIEGEQNPTLILQEDEEYTIGWTEGNGDPHNIELRDDSDEVVEDHSTDESDSEEPDDQVIEFTASSDITKYRCNPHPNMEGEIQVE